MLVDTPNAGQILMPKNTQTLILAYREISTGDKSLTLSRMNCILHPYILYCR